MDLAEVRWTDLIGITKFALLPSAALVGGGAFALWRPPNGWWRSAILHFAAGVVFAVVSVELLPDIVKLHRPLEVTLGFGGGVAAMLGIRALTRKMEASEESEDSPRIPATGSAPLGLLFGVAVDVAVDGVLIGVGFAAGAKEGKLLTLALTIELLALAFAVSAQLRARGLSPARSLKLISGLACTFLIAAALGVTLLSRLPQEYLELVLAFGLAALLFLVTEELLAEAHEEKETPGLTAAFFLGFLVLLLLSMGP